MTERIVKTNEAEANEILHGYKTYFIRSDKETYEKGYLIHFQLIKNMKPVYHQIERVRYVVTKVDTFQTAPVVRGYQLISVGVAK